MHEEHHDKQDEGGEEIHLLKFHLRTLRSTSFITMCAHEASNVDDRLLYSPQNGRRLERTTQHIQNNISFLAGSRLILMLQNMMQKLKDFRSTDTSGGYGPG